MIIRSYFTKQWNQLFLCKFHSTLIQNRLLFNNKNLNIYSINKNYSTKQSKNNNLSQFELNYNNNKNNKSINELICESFPMMSSLNSSTDEIQSQSQQNLINFDYNNNENDIKSEWLETLSRAERVVNYPTSFLSLRFLLKEEISYLAIHLKRLIETKHPILETVKSILRTNQQIRGLVVLLLSKSYNYPKHVLENIDCETNRMSIIGKRQRKLAEIADMIHVSQLLHRGVIDSQLIDSKINKDLNLGNSISVLIGDFLLANASRGLALIRSPSITGLIAKSIGDYSEGEFLKLELLKTNGNSNENSREMLENYCYLSGGSLLAHSCKSALLLAEFDEEIQCVAFDIGKYIGIAFQLSEILNKILDFDNNNNRNNDEIELFDINSVQSLLEINIKKAIALIESLDQSEASLALSKIVTNIANVEMDVFK